MTLKMSFSKQVLDYRLQAYTHIQFRSCKNKKNYGKLSESVHYD